MAYSTTKQVLEESGINTTIIQESVGTGDNSNLDFNLDNQKVIANSYSLYYASSVTSNSFTTLTESTSYTLDKNKGKIRLTEAGAATLGTNILFADYDYSEQFTDDQISRAIEKADSEINELTGRKWDTSADFTEEFDFLKKKTESDYDIYQRTESGSSDYFGEDYIVTKYLPLASVSLIQFYDENGDEETTDRLTSAVNYPDDYEFYNYGKVVLKNMRVSTGYKKIKITGTYGQSTTPTYIQELSSLMAAVRLYVNISGGSYNDVTSYSLGGTTVSVGEPYVNIREFLLQAKKRIDELVNLVGRKHIIIGVG